MNVSKRFAKTAKCLSVLGFVLLLAPFIYAFTATGERSSAEILFFVISPFIFIGLGYMLQALVAKVAGYKRKEITFDEGVKYVEIHACILPLALSVVSVLPLTAVYRVYRLSVETYIDPYALYLYIPPIVCSAMMVMGVMLWFYPYHKLIYVESAYGYGAAFLIILLISVIFGVSLIPLSVCFALFLGIFFTVSNLRSIEESLSASKFRVPSNNFRSYNLKLTLKHYTITVVTAILIFCIILLAVGAIHPDINLDAHGNTQEEDRLISEGELPTDGVTMGEFWAKLFAVRDAEGMSGLMKVSMFIVVGAFVIFVFWWIYRKHLLKKFFKVVVLLLASISDFIEGLLAIFEGKSNEDIPQSYVDTEKDIDCFVEYREYKIKEELTRQSFEINLEAKESLEEKYAYAYSVYAKLVRGHKYGVKASDTPRMITAKLSAQRKNELEAATPVYEDIRYRIVRPDETVCEAELKKLVDMVKQIL